MTSSQPSPLSMGTKAALGMAVLLVLAGGIWLIHAGQEDSRRKVEANLRSIAVLKADQIAEWRAERKTDAEILAGRRDLADDVARYLASPSEEVASEIARSSQPAMERYDFSDILLVDLSGRVRLRLNPATEFDPDGYRETLGAVVATKRPRWTPIHAGPGHPAPHLAIVTPLLSPKGDSDVIAYLVLVSDAERFLYPLIQFWPTPSATAETLLVRRDGDDVLFLNELRHRHGTALQLRIPVSRMDLPAAMAVTGQTGIVRGRDYRGVDVVAAILPVPDSPWFMVAKIDATEAFAGGRIRSRLMLALMLAAIACVGVLGVSLHQRRQTQQYRRLYDAEAALRRALERHRVTLQAIGDAVISTDTDGRVELMNPVAEELTGWTLTEARGRILDEVFQIFAGDTGAPLANPTTRVISEQRIVGLANHTVLRSRNGREIPIADSGAPIHDDDGEITGVVLVFRDQADERWTTRLTDIRLQLIQDAHGLSLENLLTRSADEIAALVDSPIACYSLISLDELTVSTRLWNGRGGAANRDDGEADQGPFEVTGIVAECLHQRRPVRRNLRDSQPAAVDHAPEIVRELAVPVVRDDRVVAVLVVANKPTDYTDRDVTTVTYLADITWDIVRQKEAEAERANLQEQLVQSQKMDSIGRLAGGIAHDFNNMLAVILGRADLMATQMSDDDPRARSLKEIEKAAKRSADLTRQLLAFARRQNIAPKILDLNQAIAGTLSMLHRLIGEDIDLSWRPGSDLWPVLIDPAQLDQILTNLCINARDAISGVGKVTIETRSVVIDDAYGARHVDVVPGGYVMLAVSDNGCGMDATTRARAFEPFFTSKKAGEGTGLGLATVYGIVKQNGGFVNVYSEPNEGATFRIYLPRHEGVPSPISVADTRAPSGRGETILLVEDEPSILEVVEQLLVELGYQPAAVESAVDALEMVKAGQLRPDLLVTDVVMPMMSGKDLAARLTALDPRLKVLYMSGYTANVIAHHGVLEEGVHFIQKPFSRAELATKIREILA